MRWKLFKSQVDKAILGQTKYSFNAITHFLYEKKKYNEEIWGENIKDRDKENVEALTWNLEWWTWIHGDCFKLKLFDLNMCKGREEIYLKLRIFLLLQNRNFTLVQSKYICVWSSLLETWTPGFTPTLHKHLYLWSDHRTKSVRWYQGFWKLANVTYLSPINYRLLCF